MFTSIFASTCQTDAFTAFANTKFAETFMPCGTGSEDNESVALPPKIRCLQTNTVVTANKKPAAMKTASNQKGMFRAGSISPNTTLFQIKLKRVRNHTAPPALDKD